MPTDTVSMPMPWHFTWIVAGSIALVLALSPTVVAAQSFFTDCISNANNATVIIDENVDIEFPNGEPLTGGDEIAFFAESGVCAGVGVWDGDDLTIPIAGPATAGTNEEEGYQNGEVLKMEVGQQSSDRIFDVEDDLTYEPCNGAVLCRDDGEYVNDVVFTITGIGSGVLPVELASFDLQLNDDRIEVAWRTLTESNNSGFTLQHRLDNERAFEDDWKTLRFVPGAGTTDEPQSYTVTTASMSYGMHALRLIQHDFDGTRSVIAEQRIEHRLVDTPVVITIAPQPVASQGTVTLTLADAGPARVDLFDMLGRRLQTLYDGSLSGSTPHTIQLDAHHLSPGQYLIRVQTRSGTVSRRLLVMR